MAVALVAVPALAQQGGGNQTGGTATPPPTTGGGTGGRGGGGGGGFGTPTPTPTPQPQRTLFVTGNVVLEDGSAPPERVLIERLCAANTIRAEGYTDSKGRFSLQVGQNSGLVVDASTPQLFDGNTGAGNLTGESSRVIAASQNPATELVYWECELRGKLAGYRSDSIPLAGKRFLDNPAIGTIVLHPLAKTDGLTISATTANAPKDARKALEKGIDEFRKQKFDKAEKELRKAVDLHPQFASAWLELGRTLEKLSRPADAKAAYQKAIEADSKFVPPYVGLYEMAFREANLEELASLTDTVIRLNPYEFPSAFYYNGVANLQLKNFEVAERSTRQAIAADTRGANPRAHYLLGMILVQTRDLAGARTSFQTFIEAAPNDNQRPTVENILAQIDKALGAPAGNQP